MANCAAYQASVYINHWHGDTNIPYSVTNTFLFRTFYQCADLVTSGQARYFFKMLPGSPANILLWLTSVVDQATILVTRGVNDPIMVNHALSGDFSKIQSPKYYEACQLVYDMFDKFNKVITGTDNPPTCLLVKNYESDAAKKATEKDACRHDRPAAPAAAAPADPSGKRSKISHGPGGFFFWAKEGRMPMPTESDKTKRVCLLHARHGSGLSYNNPCCPMLHSSPVKWPESTLNGWIKLIRETDSLTFNPDVVPGDIVMKSLNPTPR
jgi:hypothetical protein